MQVLIQEGSLKGAGNGGPEFPTPDLTTSFFTTSFWRNLKGTQLNVLVKAYRGNSPPPHPPIPSPSFIWPFGKILNLCKSREKNAVSLHVPITQLQNPLVHSYFISTTPHTRLFWHESQTSHHFIWNMSIWISISTDLLNVTKTPPSHKLILIPWCHQIFNWFPNFPVLINTLWHLVCISQDPNINTLHLFVISLKSLGISLLPHSTCFVFLTIY